MFSHFCAHSPACTPARKEKKIKQLIRAPAINLTNQPNAHATHTLTTEGRKLKIPPLISRVKLYNVHTIVLLRVGVDVGATTKHSAKMRVAILHVLTTTTKHKRENNNKHFVRNICAWCRRRQ